MALRDTNRTLPIALLRARENLMRPLRPIISEHGCTEQQWRVLRELAESGPCDATTLASRSCLLAPSMTRIIRSLEERGLIIRRSDASDSRRLNLEISDAGRTLLDIASPRIEELYTRFEVAYGRENLETLLDMLERVPSMETAEPAACCAEIIPAAAECDS